MNDMVKIKISYETAAERAAVMRQLDPILRNARIKENQNSEKYDHLYITFQPETLEKYR